AITDVSGSLREWTSFLTQGVSETSRHSPGAAVDTILDTGGIHPQRSTRPCRSRGLPEMPQAATNGRRAMPSTCW
ncbi:MAG: hypothetical protein ACK559_13650, partial [bacterium]